MRAISFLVCALAYLQGFAQPTDDTLKTAQLLVQQKEFDKAESLLHLYHQTNQNPYSYQLLAQLLYWNNQNRKALSLYEEGVSHFPNAHFLKLDFGRVLFALGKLKAAEEQLQLYVTMDSLNAEAQVMLAYLNTWKGNTITAHQKINLLKKNYPANNSVTELEQYFNSFYTNQLNAGYNLMNDDQPLRSNQIQFGYTARHSSLFSPFVRGVIGQFVQAPNELNIAWVQAGNLWQFGFGGTSIKTTAGFFLNQLTGNLLTAELSLKQKLSSAISMELSAARQPYLYTSNSINSPFLYNSYQGLLLLEQKFVNASAGLEVNEFSDRNRVTTIYAWTLLPLVKAKKIILKAGYSFNYSDAVYSTFTSVKPINDLQGQGSNTQVPGHYDPYFTPQNQQVHSLLTNIAINISSKIRIQGSCSFGFYAKADNPYLMLEKGNNNSFYISRDFYRQAYTPVEAEIEMEAGLSSRLSIQGSYKFSQLFFYTRNMANLQLNYRLIK